MGFDRLALIELISDDDRLAISGIPQAEAEGVKLAVEPDGIFSTAFKTVTRSGAFQVGGDAVGDDIPIRELTLPFNLYDNGDGIEATVHRFRMMWRQGRSITWRYKSARSGARWLRVRLSQEIKFSPETDWNLNGYAKAVVTAIAVQPMYQSAEDVQTATFAGSGSGIEYLEFWNPTDQRCYLEWDLDPGKYAFPDFSFGLESEYDRNTGQDADRVITTPTLTQRLSVMADPQYDTYVSADLSNASGLFNGVEPLYWLPPYTPRTSVPVFAWSGTAGRQVMCTMRRFWSAESGLEAGFI